MKQCMVSHGPAFGEKSLELDGMLIRSEVSSQYSVAFTIGRHMMLNEICMIDNATLFGLIKVLRIHYEFFFVNRNNFPEISDPSSLWPY